MKKLIMIVMTGFMLAACGVSDTNTTFERREIGAQGRIEMGTIIDMREVRTAGKQDGLGTLAGGVAGGAAGSMIGGNTAVNVIGAAAGAFVGATLAGRAEERLTSGTAVEFVIRKENGSLISVVQTNEMELRVGDPVLLSTVQGTTRIRSRAPAVQ